MKKLQLNKYYENSILKWSYDEINTIKCKCKQGSAEIKRCNDK